MKKNDTQRFENIEKDTRVAQNRKTPILPKCTTRCFYQGIFVFSTSPPISPQSQEKLGIGSDGDAGGGGAEGRGEGGGEAMTAAVMRLVDVYDELELHGLHPPTSPICGTPLFPISQNVNLFFWSLVFLHPDNPISPTCRTPLFPTSQNRRISFRFLSL